MSEQSLRSRFKEAVANELLEAAEQVIAADGLAGASLQSIAQRAGVAVGTIYNHYRDRQELIDALFARRRAELLAALDEASKAHAGQPFEAQLDTFVRTVFAHFDARRTYLRIALAAEHLKPKVERGADGKTRPAMQQLQERAERVVRVGVRAKRLRGDGAELLALALTSFVRAVLIAHVDEPGPFEAETERVIELFLRGAAR